MGSQYIIDTNIAIYFLDGYLTPKAQTFLRSVLKEGCIFSIITKIELLGWQFKTDADEQNARAFVQVSEVLELSDEVAEMTIALRKASKIKLPDTIIAATAIIHNLTLLTNNTTEFKGIKTLTAINPME